MQDYQTVDEIEEKFFPQGLTDATADISVELFCFFLHLISYFVIFFCV